MYKNAENSFTSAVRKYNQAKDEITKTLHDMGVYPEIYAL